ncbi:MAG: PAS domain-containing sensor histidine kinase, partial [bacterium]
MSTEPVDHELARHARVEQELQEQLMVQAKKTTQSDELFRLLVANVRDYAIFMLDPTGHITTWNIGAERIKGHTADEVIGQHCSIFYPDEEVRAGRCDQDLEAAARDGRSEDESWRVRKDGSRFWANVVTTAVRDEGGTLVGFAKITRDLTDRKRVDDERAARLVAEQANRTKDEFLAMLGHELRNPLAPIVTALQLTKLHPDTHLTRELQVIERQVQQITHLVDDLLDVSRIAQGKLELRTQVIDLRESIAKAIEIASPLMEQKRHHFELKVPPHELLVEGDAPRLTQVFTNLICNAAKYTQAGGHITVLVSRIEGHIVAEVRDDGIGIEPALLARIFEPFVQGPQHSDRAGGGLGLGLPLVRSLVELHGGKVEARSAGLRMGSRFTVRLPAAAGAPAQDRERTLLAAFRSTPASTHRIL